VIEINITESIPKKYKIKFICVGGHSFQKAWPGSVRPVRLLG